jgi:hypothetical protein
MLAPSHCWPNDLRSPGPNGSLDNPGDFFFEAGNVNHTVFNKTDAPMVHVLFEVLPADLKGPSLISAQHH